MAAKYIHKFASTADFLARAADRSIAAGIGVVSGIVYGNVSGSAVPIIDASTAQTLTNKTLTSPVLNGASGAGQVVTKSVLLTENGAGTSYTGTIAIPAGAVVQHVRVIAQALWNGTSASLNVGDTASGSGYFSGVNLKATDLLVGEVLDTSDESLWGGKNGAYLVSATGQRGPTSSNFGQYYAAGSNIVAVVTPGAADGSAGRTLVVVEYTIPTAVAQVAV